MSSSGDSRSSGTEVKVALAPAGAGEDAGGEIKVALPDSKTPIVTKSPAASPSAVAGATPSSAGGTPSGWINTETFKSVHVDVLGAKVGAGPKMVYCVASVDTVEFKTITAPGAMPQWSGAHFQFPIVPTSQYISVSVFESKTFSNRYLGRAVIGLRDVFVGQSRPGVPGALDEKAPTFTAWVALDTTTAQSEIPKSPAVPSPTSSSAPVAFPASSSVSLSSLAPGAVLAVASSPFTVSAQITSSSPSSQSAAYAPSVPAVYISARLQESSHKVTGATKVEVSATNTVADSVRHLVSKKKRRWQQDGFDLDLTYITDRIIAMGFPSTKIEGVYRNNLATMRRFFSKRHAHAYKVYNLCSERSYPASTFADGAVCRFPFADHNACAFEMIPRFCDDVDEWLLGQPFRVAAIHCKAGKGRTGLLICCYLLYTGQFPNALGALTYYGAQRTANYRGVTIPSQIRYVHYWDRYLQHIRHIPKHIHTNIRVDRAAVGNPYLVPEPDAKSREGIKDQALKKRVNDELSLSESTQRLVPLPDATEQLRLKTIRIGPAPVLLKAKDAEIAWTLTMHRPGGGRTKLQFESKYLIPPRRERGTAKPDSKDGGTEGGFVEWLCTEEGERKEEPAGSSKKRGSAKEIKTPASPARSSQKGASLAPAAAAPPSPGPPGSPGVPLYDQEDITEIEPEVLSVMPILHGDCQMAFKYAGTLGKKKMFQFWFNTQFIERTAMPPGSSPLPAGAPAPGSKIGEATLILTKRDLDGACKDKKNSKFPKALTITLSFDVLAGTGGVARASGVAAPAAGVAPSASSSSYLSVPAASAPPAAGGSASLRARSDDAKSDMDDSDDDDED